VLPILQDTTIVAAGPRVAGVSLTGAVAGRHRRRRRQVGEVGEVGPAVKGTPSAGWPELPALPG
jgi:hypothetical protein